MNSVNLRYIDVPLNKDHILAAIETHLRSLRVVMDDEGVDLSSINLPDMLTIKLNKEVTT